MLKPSVCVESKRGKEKKGLFVISKRSHEFDYARNRKKSVTLMDR